MAGVEARAGLVRVGPGEDPLALLPPGTTVTSLQHYGVCPIAAV